MKTKIIIFILFITSFGFLAFVIFEGIKFRNLSKIERVRLSGGTELEKYDRYIATSKNRWGAGAVLATNGEWLPFIKSRMNFAYLEGHKFIQSEPSPLNFQQMQGLTNRIINFFDSYADGSFGAFLLFHKSSEYTMNFSNFTGDPMVMNWINKTKHEFNTDDNKLKSIWDYTAFDNARRIWIVHRMKSDQAGGSETSANLKSKYIADLQDQFESNVETAKLNEFVNYKILALSKDDYYVYVFKSTNAILSLANFQNSLIPGTQMQGNDIFKYKHSPESIISSHGYCYYAAMTASVLVNSCDCYVPIVVSFYWSPEDNDWLPYTMGRYSMGNYFALF